MAHPAVHTMLSAPPTGLQHVRQRADGDCGVACLAMITGQSYPEAWRQVTALPSRRWEHGITLRTMQQLLGARGFVLGERRQRCVDPIHGVNLVEVVIPGTAHSFHWVVLTDDGTVHDPELEQPARQPLTAMGYQRVRAMHGVMPCDIRAATPYAPESYA